MSGFPTLIVVDASGNELSRNTGFDPDATGKWLRRWSALATSDGAAAAQLGKTPDDVRLLWAMATRAEAKRQFAHESARVAAACGKSWPKELDEAYARITIGKSAHAEAVELLEPRASAAFKRCVADAVKTVDVPADSPPVRFVVGFRRAPPAPPLRKP